MVPGLLITRAGCIRLIINLLQRPATLKLAWGEVGMILAYKSLRTN